MMWCQLLTHQKELYPNVGMLLEILLVFLGSSSVVERGFSTVQRVLHENPLSMKNEWLNQSLLVHCNMALLRKLIKNCNQMITKAVDVSITKKKWHWEIEPKRIMETEEIQDNLF